MAQDIGKAAVGGENFARVGQRKKQIVEGVDQVAIPLLRPLDQIEEFLDLSDGGLRRGALLQATHQPAQLGHLPRLPQRVGAEQTHQNHQADRQRPSFQGDSASCMPGHQRKPAGERQKNHQGETPQAGFRARPARQAGS